MPEIISFNYCKDIMTKIQKHIKNTSFEKIMWFGECNSLSLIYDYLAADGFIISAVLDNDASKTGKIIERNWCMPLDFKYIDIPKDETDLIIAGRILPKLKIILPNDIYSYIKNIENVLFFTRSYRSNEIKHQLLQMGALEKNIVILPTEQDSWNQANSYIYSQTEQIIPLSHEEHQQIMNTLLQEFKIFCEKNNLRYFLAYGSLLGAVRHKGFIPWDDDVDIIMPIEDYQKMLKEFPRNRRFEILDHTTNDNYFFPFAKLVDNCTYLHHAGFPITWMQGVYIDIFPMSGYTNGMAFEKQWLEQSLLDVKWYWYYLSRNILEADIRDPREEILKEKYKIDFDDADRAGVLTTLPAKPWILDKKIFLHTCKVKFEGQLYDAPSDYNEYLRSIYGDYMKLPPLEEQRVHSFPSFRKEL